MKKIFSVILMTVFVFGLNAGLVSAHAVVKPATAGVGSFTDFSLGVPSERDVATTTVKLMIPAGLNFVSPIVKPGWRIDVKSTPDQGKLDDDGNPAQIVSEIDWTGGQIPAGQKDIFQFSAQVPSQEVELDWKIEQTYADGSVISWTKSASDQPKDEKGNPDFSKFGPFPKTMVVNDLKPSAAPVVSEQSSAGGNSNDSTAPIAIGALALAIVSLVMQFRKKTAV